MRHLLIVSALCLVACHRPPSREDSPTSAAPSALGLPQSKPPHVASTRPSASAPPAPTAEDVPDDEATFVRDRVARAKAGKSDLVSIRVWHCGASCTCPPPCIQTVSPEMAWLDVQGQDGKPLRLASWANADVVGRFTGEEHHAKKGDEEVSLPVFRVTAPPKIVGTQQAPMFDGAASSLLDAGS